MKLLTREQLRAVLDWWGVNDFAAVASRFDDARELSVLTAVSALITAECRAHGYAGIEDAYKHLVEEKTR